jgi:diguanylate cyclase (GGDEF)-like protein/PAS domain S-box-containing protein
MLAGWGLRESWPWRSIGVIMAYSALLMAWLVLKPGTHALFVAVDNVAQFVGPLLLVPLCFLGRPRAAGAPPRSIQRWAAPLLGLGALCFACGQISYTIYQQVLHFSEVPFPSWADAVYLWAYPFMLLAILLLPGRRLPGASRARVLLDGLMIMTATVTFSWYFILGPTIQEGSGGGLATVVGLAYPLGDLVLIACLLVLWSRMEEPALRRVAVLLSVALSIIIVTDSVYDYQTAHGGYNTGGLLDLGWPLGYMLVALGGYVLRRTELRAAGSSVIMPRPTAAPRLWPSLLPAALVPAVGVLLLYTRFVGTSGQYDLGVSAGAVVLVAVIVTRQVITILENRRLYLLLDGAYAKQGLALAEREQQMRTVVANAPLILWAIDHDGICSLYEGQALAALGHTAGRYVGQSLFEACRAQPRLVDAMHNALAGEAGTLVIHEGDIVLETSWTPIRDAAGRIEGAIGVSHDITERTRAEAELQYQAFHDVLTGLPNRALFLDRLEQALTRAQRHGGTVGVLFLDLDRFKLINDSLGHAAGDLLLINVAARLKGCLRAEDTVARFGGDEFSILLDRLDGPSETLLAAERIIGVLDAPFHLDGHDVVTATSIGIVTNTPDHTPAEMVRDADTALYRAKSNGRGRYEVFDATMNARALERLELEADLRAALERKEFVVYYQPKINLSSGCLEGMEALVRWQHPRLGLVSPASFIPLAEETGLIRPIGQWVLEEACRQTKRWVDRHPDKALVTSVNLSGRQFQQPTLVDDVAHALRLSGVDPRCMQLEITESVAMEDAEAAVTILQQLKALGLQLAIDDFGTGYSSLAYLKRFPVDELKIDRAFVSGLMHESEDASIVNAVASLGHALKLSIVAEGIETAAESRHVHTLGCGVGQGFYFARPLPSAEAEAFIARSSHHAA